MKTNLVSRTIVGILLVILAVYLFLFEGVLNKQSADYIVAIILGLILLALGIFILFNKKEDEIERIKKD